MGALVRVKRISGVPAVGPVPTIAGSDQHPAPDLPVQVGIETEMRTRYGAPSVRPPRESRATRDARRLWPYH